MEFPLFVRVRQSFQDQPEVTTPEAEAARMVRESRISSRLPPGASVAVTAGSRGIASAASIICGTVNGLRSVGMNPFVVAAMGSHGGATSAGQRALLAELGMTEQTLGCEIRADMETEVVGTNPFGLPIHVDRNALQADGVVLVNRVKPHTSFTGDYESGLLKMLVVGLGKQQGAAQVHKLGLHGLRQLVPEVGALLLDRVNVVLGLAILENARERTGRLVGIEPEDLLATEPRLLDEARALMGRLPFQQIDVLIVGELGKNYSGTGIDPNVIGRQRVETVPDLPHPAVTRLAVLDLSPETRGNAVGIGLADLTTERVVRSIDHNAMNVNCFTSNFLTRARVPLSLPTDREVIATCLDTCWRIRWDEARVVLIPNTLELEELWVSEALAPEARALSNLIVDTDREPLPFGDDGTLVQEQLFPHSTRGRRNTLAPPR